MVQDTRHTVLVTGSKGQLGSAIAKLTAGSSFDFIFADREELDIAEKSDVDNFFKNNKIDGCVNCAAYTAVDEAEDNKEQAQKINVEGVKNLSLACGENGATLVHISTDYVFDGRKNNPYTEDDLPNPLSVYGKTKLDGEKEAQRHNPKTIIIRSAWLFSEYGRNFVKTIYELAKTRDSLKIISDLASSPTNANDLAEAILRILETPVFGLFHFANLGTATRYDMAKVIVARAGFDCILDPISSDDFPAKAERPQFSALSSDKIQRTFNLNIRSWEEALVDAVDKIESQG